MARTSFEILPVDGPRDPRSTSRIVNQAMSGKLNSVIDFTIPADGLPYTLVNPIFSEQSYVDLMPQNAAAALSTIFAIPGKGQCIFDDVDDTIRNATLQVPSTGNTVNIAVTATDYRAPFDTPNYNFNWGWSDANDEATSQVDGTIFASLFLNGTFPTNNTNLQLELTHATAGNVDIDVIPFIVTVGTIAEFNISAAITFPTRAQPGELFYLDVEADKTGLLTFNAILELDNRTGLPGGWPGEDLDYRALVIG